jgi:ribokinase
MIVCFGSINLDLIFPLPRLPRAGETVLGRTMRLEPGGKGANQAVAAARDGARVLFAGAVGADALADQATALLRAAGADMTRVRVGALATGAASICVAEDGGNQIAVASGANLEARSAQVEDALLGPDTTLLLQAETPLDETAALIGRGRAAGARIVLNLAPSLPLDLAAVRAVDALVVNEEEGVELGARLGVGGDAGALRRALGVVVIRTLGGDGVEAATSEGVRRWPVHPVAVVDTTAAGDCFCGVLAAALDRGDALAAAIDRARIAAALACGRAGSQASLPTRVETDAEVARHGA